MEAERSAAMTEDQRRAFALSAAADLVEHLRESNKAYETRTGQPSAVSERDYLDARNEIEAALLRVAGLRPR